jgi:hypothetical protein
LAEHLLCKERVRSSSLLVSTTHRSNSGGSAPADGSTNDELKRLGSRPEATLGSTSGAIRTTVRWPGLEPSFRVRPGAPDPCPHRRGHRPAARWGTATRGRGPAPAGPHLTNWIVVQGNRSFSISPIQFDDPDRPRRLTPGQVLEEVKLLRARGGCLGAKSR